ncbi:MAG: hypothetical protein L6R48_23410 [Planctomycetes bacterium]|nr:hypothetical protein [Planctomycetota bacterium]
MAILLGLLSRSLAPLALCAALAASDADDQRQRYSLVRQLARESNDRDLIARVEAFGKEAGKGGEAAEDGLRELEQAVGVEPGGWTMAGGALFRPQADDAARLAAATARLRAALDSGEVAAVDAAAADLRAVFGERAGLPDMRRRGRHPAGAPMTPRDAYAALRTELGRNSPLRRALRDGRPADGMMVRVYAGLLSTLTMLRPAAQRLQPDDLAELDRLGDGAAAILLALQRPDGHLPFPDLRSRHVRFGAMIEQEMAANGAQVEDGWVVSVLANGASYYDTALAGQALILAGQARQQPAWTAAGMRAASFCAQGALSTNWNYNAFATGLCADAYRVGGDPAHLAGALRLARLGVLPGQLTEGPRAGRWMDPHNARDVYHLILLRGLHDLLAALPADHPQRSAIAAAADRAVASLCAEQAAGGVAVIALRELERHTGLTGDRDPRVAAAATEQRAVLAALPTSSTNLIDLAWLAASGQ